MNDEFLLTVLYMMAGIGALLYLAYLVWFMKTAERFRDEPVLAACAWMSMTGALLFFGSMVSMGYLSFAVPTPWGPMQSEWVGALIALAGLAVRYAVSVRKRRKRVAQAR
jgi:membrane protein DedA with SNARE-associated domain